jgi:hypothetical protein
MDPFKAAGGFLEPNADGIRASNRPDVRPRRIDRAGAPTALMPPQIFRGYQ